EKVRIAQMIVVGIYAGVDRGRMHHDVDLALARLPVQHDRAFHRVEATTIGGGLRMQDLEVDESVRRLDVVNGLLRSGQTRGRQKGGREQCFLHGSSLSERPLLAARSKALQRATPMPQPITPSLATRRQAAIPLLPDA